MDENAILTEVNEIFKKVLDDDSVQLTFRTTTDDVESWDSLNHIHIITAIEKKYKIRFELNELLNFENVGDLCKGIKKKLNK